MKRIPVVLVAAGAMLAFVVSAQQAPTAGPYSVQKKAKVGGAGGTDYIYADSDGRRLYIPRTGNPARIAVYDLDTLAPVGEVPSGNAHGAAVSTKSGHGFATSKPVVMWDTKTLAAIKTIDVQGNPDGILYDAFNDHVYILSHQAPNATVINAADGSVLGTIDLGGAPEQGVTDGKGHLYFDIEDKGNIAVVDAKTMMATAHYDLAGKGGQCAGLAMDAKNNILFAACRMPAAMVILNAGDGKILDTLPIGGGTDGATFNPNTMEAFSAHTDGVMYVIKENSQTSFAVEQTVPTMQGARTLTLDSKKNRVLLMAFEMMPPAAASPGAPPAAPPADGRGGRGGFGGRGGGRGQQVPDSFTIMAVGK